MNQLTVLDRIARRATTKALKNINGALSAEYEKLGITYENLYEQYLDEEFRLLEKGLQLKPRLDELLIKYNMANAKPENLSKNYLWITLRPADIHVDRFNDFKHIVLTQYLTRNMFINYKYAWEQKGETPDEIGKGYHIHILAHCPNYLKGTQLKKDTKSTFNKFCNGEVHDAFVDYKYVRTKDDFFSKRAYMMGYKSDDWKDPACAMDIPWRKKYNLDNLYGDLDLENP